MGGAERARVRKVGPVLCSRYVSLGISLKLRRLPCGVNTALSSSRSSRQHRLWEGRWCSCSQGNKDLHLCLPLRRRTPADWGMQGTALHGEGLSMRGRLSSGWPV